MRQYALSSCLSRGSAAFRAYQTYLCDDYGVADGVIAVFVQALDAPVRAALCSWIEAELARLPTRIRLMGVFGRLLRPLCCRCSTPGMISRLAAA
jgi:hypothetical protein